MGADADPRSGVRRYCVLSPGRAGDFILTTGLFNALKAYDPTCELTIVVGPRAAGMAQAHPAIDRVLVFDRHPLRLIPFLARLRAQVFDAWLDPKDHYSTNQALLARVARARVKVGFNRAGGGPFSVPLQPPVGPHEHFSVEMLKPLDLLGIPAPRPPRLSLGIPESSVRRAEAILGGGGRFTVLVNLSAGHPLRYWGEARWRAALQEFAAVRKTRFLVSAAPEDRPMAERVGAVGQDGVSEVVLLPAGSILDVAAVVAGVDAVVTVDTSIVHLAAVYDRPIVALYRDDQHIFDMFRPLSSKQEVVMCAPGQPLTAITPGQVGAAYRKLVTAL